MKKTKELNWQNNEYCLVATDDDNCPIVFDKQRNLLYRLVPNAGMFGFHLECFKNKELLWRTNFGFEEFDKLGAKNQEAPED